MDSLNKEIGMRIRALRQSRHITQSQLAGNSITRNMLSLIENGYASPSLHTLTDLAIRLDVPVGYFFASNENEISQFIKMSMISDIRSLFSSESYEQCLSLCTSLSHPDDEVRMLIAECYLSLAQANCINGNLVSASSHLSNAAEAASICAYNRDSILSTVKFVEELIACIKLPLIPPEICDSRRFPISRVPSEFFVYLTALAQIENNNIESAKALTECGLIQTPIYLDLLRSLILLQQDTPERAEAGLIRLMDTESPGFFTSLRILNALETYARMTEDYKMAYQYSSQKVHLLEQFSR